MDTDGKDGAGEEARSSGLYSGRMADRKVDPRPSRAHDGGTTLRAVLSAPDDVASFLATGVVVLDANVLLGLYRVTARARAELLGALEAVSPRLWLPHQAAMEFRRNRISVVVERNRSLTRMQNDVTNAVAAAKSALAGAVNVVTKHREMSGTTRSWTANEHGLGHEELETKLQNIVRPLRDEVGRLRAEHDVQVDDVTSLEKDPVLAPLSAILGRNVGSPYTPNRLREIVDEAVAFRFPNRLPPGYADAGKETSTRAAGDYIIWRQVIDRIGERPAESRKVVLVTGDVKEDWWELGSDGQPIHVRHELREEFEGATEHDLLLLTTRGFLEGASAFLGKPVSSDTLAEVDAASEEAADEPEDSPDQTFTIMRSLVSFLQDCGYDLGLMNHISGGYGPVALLRDSVGDRCLIAIRQANSPTSGKRELRTIRDAMNGLRVDAGLWIVYHHRLSFEERGSAARFNIRPMTFEEVEEFARSAAPIARLFP